jgi:hypothetical protein
MEDTTALAAAGIASVEDDLRIDDKSSTTDITADDKTITPPAPYGMDVVK